MADPRLPAFQIYVRVTPPVGEEFKVRFDFSGNPRQGVDIYCSRDLSELDALYPRWVTPAPLEAACTTCRQPRVARLPNTARPSVGHLGRASRIIHPQPRGPQS
jgi:hypothetical protein